MKLLYFILHTFTDCPDEDLEYFKDAKGTEICKKCGRKYFVFHI